MPYHPVLFGTVGILLVLLLSGYLYEEIARRRDTRRYPPPGRFIDVGGHRLHLLTKGAEGPTVVIEQGAGEPSIAWLALVDEIATFARVCIYDRAGYQWSDPVGLPRSLEDRVTDLHALLTNAALPKPYILVAHSYGGFLVRLFARDYPDSVAGMVLIDTPYEGVYFRKDVLARYAQMAGMLKVVRLLSVFGLPRLLTLLLPSSGPDSELSRQVSAAMIRREYFAAASDDISSLQRASSALRKPETLGSLGKIPLAVITHGKPFPGPFAVLENGWSEGQQRLASLSSNSALIVAENANHMIHQDDPELVLDAIRRVVDAVRSGASVIVRPNE